LLPFAVWGCAKLKHAAYSIHLSAPNINRNLELKNIITELKNSVEGFSSRSDQAEDMISELDDRWLEIIY
jgi:hypothetical protein